MLLVALDIEGCAPDVVAQAGQLAKELDCPMELMAACRVPGTLRDDAVLPGHEHNAHDEVEADALRHLRDLAQPWIDQGVQAQFYVRFGKPVDVILERAASLRPRMLVMGTHARTGLSRVLFGSVEENVVRQVSLPVLVIPVKHAEHHATETLESLRAESDG